MRPGDLIIVSELIDGSTEEILGMVVDAPEEYGYYIQFYGGDNYTFGPLHYLAEEITDFLDEGIARIIYAS
jgi:hypothetical protein